MLFQTRKGYYMKKRWVLSIGIIIASIGVAICSKGMFKESNFEKYKSVEDVKSSNIVVADFYYESIFCGYEGHTLQDTIDEYIDFYETDECVFVVEPTGNLNFQSWITMQEVVIKEVVRGSGDVGERCYIINQGGRIATENNAVNLWSYGVNLMLPGKEYLLFCNSCELSEYRDETYYVHSPGIFYFALDDECVAAVYEEGKFYKDYPQCEFYVESEATIQGITEFKKQIMEHFCNKE